MTRGKADGGSAERGRDRKMGGTQIHLIMFSEVNGCARWKSVAKTRHPTDVTQLPDGAVVRADVIETRIFTSENEAASEACWPL